MPHLSLQSHRIAGYQTVEPVARGQVNWYQSGTRGSHPRVAVVPVTSVEPLSPVLTREKG